MVFSRCSNQVHLPGRTTTGETSGSSSECLYEEGGASFKEFRPVIFASGGFRADFTQNSCLATNSPDLLHLLTTNGGHCTDDVITGLKSQTTQMPKSSSSQQKRSSELVVLSSKQTETVLPRSWEGGAT